MIADRLSDWHIILTQLSSTQVIGFRFHVPSFSTHDVCPSSGFTVAQPDYQTRRASNLFTWEVIYRLLAVYQSLFQSSVAQSHIKTSEEQLSRYYASSGKRASLSICSLKLTTALKASFQIALISALTYLGYLSTNSLVDHSFYS